MYDQWHRESPWRFDFFLLLKLNIQFPQIVEQVVHFLYVIPSVIAFDSRLFVQGSERLAQWFQIKRWRLNMECNKSREKFPKIKIMIGSKSSPIRPIH